MNTSEVVNDLLVRQFGVAEAEIRYETPLRNLRMDSLALEELRVLIEDRLDVDLEEVPLTSRDTVGTLVSAVDGKVAV
ncbi:MULTISPECIES: acyl carrier protein [unclassified Streptomyces]|uniref:acyl carrier protein n=1 Tax=unclassified Streptomyces TaxID=2593676 RepID=UPI00382B814C